ncbi:MAG: alpha-amylase family glycosyl hydrolase [Nannocystaceae bacterium]
MHLPVYRPAPLDAADETAVVLGLRGAAGRGGISLCGDVVHWLASLPLARAPDGGERHEVTLRLSPGVYAYKFRRDDGQWMLDPDNPRTRSVDGQRNNALVVGGTDEPVLHAPAAPDLWLGEDGRSCVRAALRKDAGEVLAVRWDEGEGPRQEVMAVVGHEDEHWLLEAWLPTSARTFEYAFVLPDGRVRGRAGGPGQAFRVPRKVLRRTTPAWWRQAVLYTVLVDRFRVGGRKGQWPARRVEEPDEAALRRGRAPRSIPFGRVDIDQQRRMAWEQGFAGGDLGGVLEALPYLEQLGVTVLHLSPVFEARSAHRYDVVDMHRVDPALGGDAALRRLLDAAHARSLRVLLDIPVSHVHRDFFAFADVREHGPKSPYWGWFHVREYPFREGLEPGYLDYARGAWQEPVLRTDHPGVVAYLVDVFERWARFGVDGFRIDAAADVPLGLVRRIRAAVRAIAPQAVVFGEVVPDNVHRWTRGAVDAATDFSAQQAVYAWLLRGEGATRAAAMLARRRFVRDTTGWSSLAFTATHDQARLRTLVGRPQPARLGHLLVLLRAAVPALLYGDEVGLHSDAPERSFEDAWPDRMTMPWEPEAWDEATLELHRRALALRRELPALREGDEHVFAPLGGDDAVLGLRRQLGDAIVEVFLNGSDQPKTIALPPDAPSDAVLRLVHGDARRAPTAPDGTVLEGAGALTLGPWSAAVVERRPATVVLELLDTLREDNQARAEAAFVEGSLAELMLPTRLYLTVTEACNLRCDHCITHAPAKTRSGQARQVQPWLLEALRPAFEVVSYVGFSHGGESLVSSMFPVVLEAIGDARRPGQGRCDVHLLSNGMRLQLPTVQRLHAQGVSSLAVSLDGATAASNDGLRRGGSFDTIVDNLRSIAQWRARERVDLRVGISMVAGVGNVHELPAMGRLIRELGLDWLKVEEVYPATPRAAVERLDPRDPAFEAAMAELGAELEGSTVVLVDHRAAPPGCWCTAAPGTELRRFLEADAFANRTRFSPCRMAWEQACIDPDGTVHAVSYESPAIGSLAHASLLELWNGPAAQHLRQRALHDIAPAVRRACPGTPRATIRSSKG